MSRQYNKFIKPPGDRNYFLAPRSDSLKGRMLAVLPDFCWLHFIEILTMLELEDDRYEYGSTQQFLKQLVFGGFVETRAANRLSHHKPAGCNKLQYKKISREYSEHGQLRSPSRPLVSAESLSCLDTKSFCLPHPPSASPNLASE